MPWAIWYTIHFTYHHRHHLCYMWGSSSECCSFVLLFYEKWKINNIKFENIKQKKTTKTRSGRDWNLTRCFYWLTALISHIRSSHCLVINLMSFRSDHEWNSNRRHTTGRAWDSISIISLSRLCCWMKNDSFVFKFSSERLLVY